MGIRGIDIQVAIQRAVDAEKLQQGETSQARAGEAGLKEEAKRARARRQEQPQQTERQDQVIIRSEREQRREGDRRNGDEDTDEVSEEADGQESQGLKKPRRKGRLDILA